MTIGTKSKIRQEARREQVLNAAAKCFVEQGFHGASMSKIAKAADMSVGHIYHYFESKDAIIMALVEREHAVIGERVAELEALPSDQLVVEITSRVKQGVRRQIDPFQSVLNLEIIAESQRNPDMAAQLHANDKVFRDIFQRLLGDGLGLDNVEPRIELLFVLFHGLPSRALRHPGIDGDALDPYIDQMLGIILN